MLDKVDGEENAMLGEKNSKLAEKKGIEKVKKPRKNIEKGIKTKICLHKDNYTVKNRS